MKAKDPQEAGEKGPPEAAGRSMMLAWPWKEAGRVHKAGVEDFRQI